jgi:hypothetical protein
VEQCRTDIAGIADLPPLPDICYDEFYADAASNDSLNLGRAEDIAPISLK